MIGAQFTPGPWYVAGGFQERGKGIVRSSARSDGGSVTLNQPGDRVATVCSQHRAANAALIAAAPDLYAALEECADELQDWINNYMAGEEWDDHPEMVAKQATVDTARSALALASGAAKGGQS